MKRKDAITCIMYAGYHEDTAAGMRLYIENRVSYATYKKAFNIISEDSVAAAAAGLNNRET